MIKKLICSVLYVTIGVVLLFVNTERVNLDITEMGMITIVRVYAIVGFVLALLSSIFKKKR